MLGRAAEGSPTLLSLSPFCLGICLHRKLPRLLSFLVLRSPGQVSQAPFASAAVEVYLTTWACCHFSCACTLALIPSPRGFCLSVSFPITACFGFFGFIKIIIYPYSTCLSPCVFLVSPLRSHSLPSRHILSGSPSLYLFSISLFIQTILRLSVSNLYPPNEWK